jgi:phospholipid/cholesterol/gamma-HCH transport system permease protein
VVIALIKAMLFGLTAGSSPATWAPRSGGGPAGVGNAVNETVVFSFIALFVINVIITAVGFQVTL